MTDLNFSKLGLKSSLQQILQKAVDQPGSLNRISVDSDQSTSDTMLCISSNKAEVPAGVELDAELLELKVSEALTNVCKSLAENVVRNGEGVEHVVKVSLQRFPTEQLASRVGRKIVNSPLVKTAIAGDDPNVGRILCAIGNALSELPAETDLTSMEVKIGDHIIFTNQEFTLDQQKESLLVDYFKQAKQKLEGYPAHQKSIEISVDFGNGNVSSQVIGADLTHRYVSENASYRS